VERDKANRECSKGQGKRAVKIGLAIGGEFEYAALAFVVLVELWLL
jgi:hypothetical protein